ncbi:MAG: beta-lactamase family protein, partial [Planctomycetes bacterium]|nr:beta-lactamase family protein [Planctomycetota bacterium]
ISKPITATALMVLVERGKIALDRPVNEYLGEAKLRCPVGDANEATVRCVANHTSGLPLHYQFFYEDEAHPRPDMAESIRRYGVLVAPPGERYQYANFGYGILEHIIERQSGKSYDQFLREEVFLPLGMTRTAVGIPPELEEFAAARYTPDQSRLPFYDFDHRGASAVFSSAHDLVRFGMFHVKQPLPEQKKILSDESLDEMLHDPISTGGGPLYGIGWAIQSDEFGCRTITHTGGMGGVRTVLKLVPEENLAVVVLTNSEFDLRRHVERKILKEMLPPREEPADSENGAEEKSDDESPEDLSDVFGGEWFGEVQTYAGNRPITLKVQCDGDVHLRLNGGLWTLLNEPRFADGRLTGVFQGDIETDDANRRPYHLHLNVRRRDDKLNGALTAISLPGSRAGNALSYFVELKKVEKKSAATR